VERDMCDEMCEHTPRLPQQVLKRESHASASLKGVWKMDGWIFLVERKQAACVR
jgi:hypothetical protein